MRVAFRVDASAQIGTGHFMRCLTLADALKRRGGRVRFVCRHLPESLRTLLKPSNHELALLNGSVEAEALDELAHAHFLGNSQRSDAAATLRALSDSAWDWMIVDHYGLDARWESTLREAARRVMVIDDIADRVHDCDVLLDQNLYPDMDARYVGKVPDGCQVLLGPHYALLRDEFPQLRERSKPRSGSVRRILVFLGGVDPENLTARAIEAVNDLGLTNLLVDVVIGADHPHRLAIEAACKTYRYSCHVQTTRMAELMSLADVAVGAGGSASWERCCLGLATASVAFADNQVEIAAALDHVGACVFVGNQHAATQQKIAAELGTLIADQARVHAISRKAFSLVDGRGSERVREIVCSR